MPDNDPSLEKLTAQINKHLAAEHKRGTAAQQHAREIIEDHLRALESQAELKKKSKRYHCQPGSKP